MHFLTLHIENHRKRSHICNSWRIIFKLHNDIHWPKIWDEFDYEGSTSLNMAFLGSFFKLESTNLVQM